MLKRWLVTLVLGVGLAAVARAAEDEEPKAGGGPAEFKFLKYRSIGPAVGGRVCRSAGVPGDPYTFYAGTASGGLWKSTDGGYTFKPIFDEQPSATIGSLAVAPSDPNVIYVGTGEANIRGNVQAGIGIFKSVDAGKTWKHVWKQEGQIGTMIVHPRNPDVAFAAVLGHAFGPNPERGVYRTRDGGKSWEKVLSKDADTGASDVCFDPSNPHILFAGLWQTRRFPWELVSGGPGSGLYESRDGGDTWKQLKGSGLPEGTWGKVGVAAAPSNSQRVYALIEAEKGGLYRSDDGGEHWSLANGGNYLRQRAWYYSTLTVDPRNPDVVWCPQVRMLRTADGGKTFHSVRGMHHGDHHDMWIDPVNPERMIDSNDGGVDVTTNGGRNWHVPQLPIAQFYHIAVDTRVPYHVSGCMQDLGTASGPSNSLSGSISNADWYDVGGGETGFTVPDPSDPNIIYAGEYGGYISRFDLRTRQGQNRSIYPTQPSGHGAEDLRYRFQWTAPILISPHDSHVIYHGANVLFKTSDAGLHWSAISGDLTRNDKTKQKWSGGPITGDNTGAEYFDTIFAVAESPKEKGLLWVGSDDGLVHVSRDGGKSWENVTPHIQGLPEWATIDCIEASPHDAATAYVIGDNHRLDDMRPYLFQTNDYGKSWKKLSANLPQDVYLHAVREDPKKKGILYAGTERGVVYSLDDGATWRELKMNFPTVAVHDLVVKGDDLVLGTHGRSVWILDDLTPFRSISPKIVEAPAHLFAPVPARRYRFHGTFVRGSGENPPAGAIINYYLKQKPKKDLRLDVLDAKGNLVAEISSKPASEGVPESDPDGPSEREKKVRLTRLEGLNRVNWDLRYKGAEEIKGAKNEGAKPEEGPLAPPGTYTLRLKVEDQMLETTLVVEADPRVHVPADVLEAELKMTISVRDDVTQVARMVRHLQSVRTQVNTRNELLKDQPKAEALIKSGKELLTKVDALEDKLHNPKAKVLYDILAQKGGAKLYSKLTTLYEFLLASDGPLTQGMQEVFAESERELKQYEAEYKSLMNGDLTRLNEAARKLEVPNVIIGQ